jgi:hypothetical protein
LQTSSVVHCRVDAEAGAQARHRSRQLGLGLGDRILCGQGGVVGVKAQHGVAPKGKLILEQRCIVLSSVQDDHVHLFIKCFMEIFMIIFLRLLYRYFFAR